MEKAQQILKSYFGYSQFRPKQEEIIVNILDGKDTIVLMPTGGGKSLCFQVPALMYESGVTLVISPLISLMKDQVEALKGNGVNAAYFNSSQTDAERNLIVSQAQKGELKLLYMAPETIMVALGNWLKHVELNLIAIDEAHCVSMWGHDFRPEYTQLNELRVVFPEVAFMALTATADKATRKEIDTKLGLKNPTTYLSSFDRPNLSLEVRGNLPKNKKQQEILHFIQSRKGQSGIIYCLSRNETEDMSSFLIKNGIKAAHYHAGLSSEERSKVQEDFINDNMPVISATIAFGMGIDKSNVRWVIHNNLPKNIEGYYQEIGRAGRDGLASETQLYYSMRDVKLLASFANESVHKEVLLEKLNRMLQYAESQTCRRITLLSYFSEKVNNKCGNCDVCKNPPAFFDGTVIAQKALSAIKRTDEKVGTNLLIQILRGAQTIEVYEQKFNLIKTYGVGKEHGYEEWRHYINQLLNYGVIEIAYDENFKLKITSFGNDILFGKFPLSLTKYVAPVKVSKFNFVEEVQTNSVAVPSDIQLFQTLRKEIADEKSVPAYIIFSDATLKNMAELRPRNEEEMMSVSGVGLQKLENFGDIFLKAIEDFEKINGEKTRDNTFFNSNRKSNRIKKAPNVSTYKITMDLLNSGMTPEEITTQRNLNFTTICSHIAKLIVDGNLIDTSKLIDSKEVETIKAATTKVESLEKLQPMFEYFNNEMPYYKIRLAFAIIQREAKNLNSL